MHGVSLPHTTTTTIVAATTSASSFFAPAHQLVCVRVCVVPGQPADRRPAGGVFGRASDVSGRDSGGI
jgi:hypothetical protein